MRAVVNHHTAGDAERQKDVDRYRMQIKIEWELVVFNGSEIDGLSLTLLFQRLRKRFGLEQ